MIRREARPDEAITSIVEQLDRFDPGANARARESRDRTLRLLRETRRPLDRGQFDPGHMTASAIVLSPDRAKVLLLFHEKLDRWLQPGGHVEAGDGTILNTALREVDEETGVTLDLSVAPGVAGVDVHAIPATAREPEHLHHDVIFRLIARDHAIRCSFESQAVEWAPLGEIGRFDLDPPLRANLRRALAL